MYVLLLLTAIEAHSQGGGVWVHLIPLLAETCKIARVLDDFFPYPFKILATPLRYIYKSFPEDSILLSRMKCPALTKRLYPYPCLWTVYFE